MGWVTRLAAFAVATAPVVVGDSTVAAGTELSALNDAVVAIEEGDDARVREILVALGPNDAGLPDLVLDGLAAGDVERVRFGIELIEASDRDLYDRVVVAIEHEQDLLPGPGAVGSDPTGPAPDPGAVRDVDAVGAALLSYVDHRKLQLPEDARTALELIPRPGAGERGPAPVVYESARRQVQELIAQSDLAAATAPRDESTAGWLPIVAVIALGVFLLIVAERRQRTHRHLLELATTDSLTGLKNRRQLDQDVADSASNGEAPIAVVMIDVDHFKRFNDQYGHGAGDDALQRVGRAISANVRIGDRPYRYGGEEFSVLLPGAEEADARLVAERIRASIEAIEISPGLRVTASVGVARGSAADIRDTIDTADTAMFSAKNSGRNRVVVAGPVETTT